MSPKAANLIWNENDHDISYHNFFPASVLERIKLKDLRRDMKREYSRIEGQGSFDCSIDHLLKGITDIEIIFKFGVSSYGYLYQFKPDKLW